LSQRSQQQFYTTSQFAHRAAVTARTLRFYDKVGLLSPSHHTEVGHRLYSDQDLVNLQQILSLKFLGFSLDEIKVCLQTDPQRLRETLATQKEMMREKRNQLEKVIQAIEQAETLLEDSPASWDALVNMIQVMQMEQSNAWVNKYLTPEQQQKMAELSRKSYSPEAAAKIAEWGKNWTEEDQQRATQQWDAFYAGLRRLVAEGVDPTRPEAQALVRQRCELLNQFSHGDAEVAAGLKQWWENHEQLPPQERPASTYSYSPEELAFMQKAADHYKQQKSSSS